MDAGIILAIVMGSSLLFLLLVFLRARTWSGLDEFILYLPVIGALYERFFRRETYYRQDQSLMYSTTVGSIVRAKVVEMCALGGVEDPKFHDVTSPGQILSEKDLAKYFGRAQSSVE